MEHTEHTEHTHTQTNASIAYYESCKTIALFDLKKQEQEIIKAIQAGGDTEREVTKEIRTRTLILREVERYRSKIATLKFLDAQPNA